MEMEEVCIDDEVHIGRVRFFLQRPLQPFHLTTSSTITFLGTIGAHNLSLRTGINLVAGLEQEEWRAKNRRFKRDLEEQLGPEELKHFKVPV